MRLEQLRVTVIGCGGIGSYLIPPLAKMLASIDSKVHFTLIDGDKFEERNTSRQLCSARQIGLYKAAALAKEYVMPYKNIESKIINKYVKSSADIVESDVTFLCVDNHPARLSVLTSEGKAGLIISAANEETSAEAFVFHNSWKGINELDPLRYYPEIATDKSGVHAGAGCTADAQELTEHGNQTAAANFIAASLAMMLFTAWLPEISNNIKPFLPFRAIFNGLSVKTFTVADAFLPSSGVS